MITNLLAPCETMMTTLLKTIGGKYKHNSNGFQYTHLAKTGPPEQQRPNSNITRFEFAIYCSTNTHSLMLIYRVPWHALPNKTTVPSLGEWTAKCNNASGDDDPQTMSILQTGSRDTKLT